MTYDPELARKNARLGLKVLGVVLVMLGLAFASAPLYDLFCRATGFGGTPLTGGALPQTVLDRTVTIKFNADTGRNMPWDFKPEMREITIKLGQKGITAYHAANPLSYSVTGTAVYNVTPDKAGPYFHKIECFCFSEQTLTAGQNVSMPVLFYIDPAMDADPNMKDVKVITLSYTFFEAGSQELDEAIEGLYNSGGAGTEIPSAKP